MKSEFNSGWMLNFERLKNAASGISLETSVAWCDKRRGVLFVPLTGRVKRLGTSHKDQLRAIWKNAPVTNLERIGSRLGSRD